LGAFLNGICQNVIQEFRRRWHRDGIVPETPPDPADRRLTHSDVFELHDAIIAGMNQLSPRDREILQAFYFDERPKGEILAKLGVTDETFRVVLSRAKDRFRKIYHAGLQHRGL
jgi:RNA polymerase sigma factor (sigma-70 family)